MSLAPRSTLAHYEILATLGAGAMGEVYRARDAKLGREVAIKILPEHFADDPERLLRFEREAKSLASLNHPNIAQIYGADREGDLCYLVLELVPGETLEERLRRGPLPATEAAALCQRIAEGLEAAHEAGVIHRDLKPANIRITPEGSVKLLDFGLAKPTQSATASGSSVDSVLTTEQGRLLGTPTYMAPEQARGKPIDRRVDLWALGCVLYECLAGRRAFAGESLSDVLAAVLEREPDWSAIPPETPERVREVLRRCLEKDARLRLRDAGEARIALDPTKSLPLAGVRPKPTIGWPRAAALVAAGAAAGVIVGIFGAGLRGAPPAAARSLPLRASLIELGLRIRVWPRLAPNGRTVVFLSGDDRAKLPARLVRRSLATGESDVLPGTENAATFCFSPDGASLAALVPDRDSSGGHSLVRVDLGERPRATRLGAWPGRMSAIDAGIAWLRSGEIVGTIDPRLLVRFPADGKTPARTLPITRSLENWSDEVALFRALPDGRRALGLSYAYEAQGYVSAVVALDLETGRESVVLRNAGHALALGSSTLLFTRADTLLRVGFDPISLAVLGEPAPILAGLRARAPWQGAWFDAAADGTVLWLPGGVQGTRRQILCIGSDGRVAPYSEERLPFDGFLVSAQDGSFVTVSVTAASGLLEMWGSDPARPLLRRLLAVAGTDVAQAFAIPGTEDLAYLTRGRDSGARIVRSPRSDPRRARVLLESPAKVAADFEFAGVHPDGKWLLVQTRAGDEIEFSRIPIGGGAATPLFSRRPVNGWPKISPDGAWIAYSEGDEPAKRVLIRALAKDGSVGPEIPVPPLPGEAAGELEWQSGMPHGRNELVLLGVDQRTVEAIPIDGESGPRFGAPRRVGVLEGIRVVDLATLPGGRVLALVTEPGEEDLDRIEIATEILSDR